MNFQDAEGPPLENPERLSELSFSVSLCFCPRAYACLFSVPSLPQSGPVPELCWLRHNAREDDRHIYCGRLVFIVREAKKPHGLPAAWRMRKASGINQSEPGEMRSSGVEGVNLRPGESLGN